MYYSICDVYGVNKDEIQTNGDQFYIPVYDVFMKDALQPTDLHDGVLDDG